MRRLSTVVLAGGFGIATLVSLSGQSPKLPVPAFDQSAVGARGYFYVGGNYAGEPGKQIMQGQMYAEVVAPKRVRRPYPLVLPWCRPNGDELDGHPGWSEGLG